MATMQYQFSSSLIQTAAPLQLQKQQFGFSNIASGNLKSPKKCIALTIRAAKLPTGVAVPKAEPNLKAPFLGFTKNAEIWNSRASMIGLIGTFIVELILNKGILQLIGVEIGKGLDIPL